jgi:diaminopimelate epimerase
MLVPFVKMQGAGNDYVYVDAAACPIAHPEALSRAVSHRRFGVGSDGLVLILPSSRADFRMRIFNADGSEAAMCGNACRCAAKFARDQGMTRKASITLETLSGIRAVRLLSAAGSREALARVEMGRPSFRPEDIPACTPLPELVEYPLPAGGQQWPLTALSMGNPHGVIFCREPEGLNLSLLGPEIQSLPLFPEGINLEFARADGPRAISLRVWERGSGETWACGTGACAAAAAAVRLGLCPSGEEISVRSPGGELSILCRPDGTLSMAGPAVTVFAGEFLWEGR